MRLPCATTSIAWLLGFAGCVANGGSDPPKQLAYRIEVIAAGSNLASASPDGFEVRSRPPAESRRLFFETSRFVEELSFPLPFGIAESATFELSSYAGSKEMDRTTLRPFLCLAHPDYSARTETGWGMEERHQVVLTSEGELGINSDLRWGVLRYRCEMHSPSGRDGEGIATLFANAATCEQRDRAETDVLLRSSAVAGSRGAHASECYAVFTNREHGILTVFLSFAGPWDRATYVQLGHCLGLGETGVSTTLRVGEGFPVPSCKAHTGAVAFSYQGEVHAHLVSGHWRLESDEPATGGRVQGEVDLVFMVEPTAEELRILGHLDLPVVAVPWR